MHATFREPRSFLTLLVCGALGVVLGCAGPTEDVSGPGRPEPARAVTDDAHPAAGDTPPPPASTPATPGAPGAAITEPTPTDPTGTVSTTASPSTAVVSGEQLESARRGVFTMAGGTGAVTGTGPLTTYSVEVEELLGLDAAEVASIVEATLSDSRSWSGDGSTSLRRVDSGADIRVIVASPATVDERCLPLNTIGIYSCRSGNAVNINSDRWLGATSEWTLGLDAYRSYVINHEVGHALGHGHEQCGGAGTLAPVMMQQTKGLQGCVGNPWPFP